MSIGMSGVKSVVSYVISNTRDDGISHVNCNVSYMSIVLSAVMSAMSFQILESGDDGITHDNC